MALPKNIGVKQALLADAGILPTKIKVIAVVIISLLVWWLFSLNEAGCVLVLLAVLLGVLKQKSIQSENKISDQLDRITTLAIPRSTAETLQENEAFHERLKIQRLQEDLRVQIKFLEELRTTIQEQNSELYRLEISIAFVGTFLWGFGDRIERLLQLAC